MKPISEELHQALKQPPPRSYRRELLTQSSRAKALIPVAVLLGFFTLKVGESFLTKGALPGDALEGLAYFLGFGVIGSIIALLYVEGPRRKFFRDGEYEMLHVEKCITKRDSSLISAPLHYLEATLKIENQKVEARSQSMLSQEKLKHLELTEREYVPALVIRGRRIKAIPVLWLS